MICFRFEPHHEFEVHNLEQSIMDLNDSLEAEKDRCNKLEGTCEVLKGKLTIIKAQLETCREIMSHLDDQDNHVTYSTKKRKGDNRHRSPLNRDNFTF